MFHRNAFKPASFEPTSWRFDLEVEPPDVVPPDVIPYGSGRTIYPDLKKRKRDRDDDVLLFLLR